MVEVDARQLSQAIRAAVSLQRLSNRPLLADHFLHIGAADGAVTAEAHGGYLTFCIRLSGGGEGQAMVPMSAARMMPRRGQLGIEQRDAEVMLTTDAGTFSLPTIPVINTDDGRLQAPEDTGRLSLAHLAAVVPTVLRFADHDQYPRPVLTGVHVDAEGRPQATDGYWAVVGSDDPWLLRPLAGRTLPAQLAVVRELATLAPGEELAVRCEDDLVALEGQRLRLQVRCVEGSYPPLLDLLPGAYPVAWTVDGPSLAQLLTLPRPTQRRETRVTLTLQGRTGLWVVCQDDDGIRASGSLQVQAVGDHWDAMQFSASRLGDLLRLVGGPVTLELSGPRSACRIRHGGASYFLMPRW